MRRSGSDNQADYGSADDDRAMTIFKQFGERMNAAKIGLLTFIIFGAFCGFAHARPGLTISGRVISGSPSDSTPVTGSTVTLYQAAVRTAHGTIPVLKVYSVSTNRNGSFVMRFGNRPQPTAILYVIATGGTVSGGKNSKIGLLSVLGIAPFPSNSIKATVNELTTVAGEWALAQFFNRSGQRLGSASNPTPAEAVKQIIADLVDPTAGIPASFMPSAAQCSGESPPINCDALERLNTISNMLSACAQNGRSSHGCKTLFDNTGTPSNGSMLRAAHTIATHPAANVSSLFNLAAGGPYSPALNSAPSDLIVAVNFRGGGLSATAGIAVDGFGNIWVANENNSITELDPTGVALSPASGFTGGGLDVPAGLAVDTAGNIWVANSSVPTPPPVGSCLPSSSLSVLVSGSNVTSYVPKANWGSSATGVSVLNVEGSSITPTLIPTTNAVNSCASNSATAQTICTANNTDVYLLSGTTLTKTLTSGGSGTISFSGGSCTNCGVAMDGVHNKAVIGLSLDSAPGFQYLDLGTSTFEPAFTSPAGIISEDPLIDPISNLLLSASENNNYEIINVATTTSPAFFENSGIPSGGELDSSGEDCSTEIALAPAEFSAPSNVFIADLKQATLTTGSPAGTWTAASQVQTLSESSLSAGANGIAVAQGTHTGIVSGEFGGDAITAIALPTTSGSGTPAINDWVTCSIGSGFSNGFDPHTVTAYQSPNSSKHAIALLANGGASEVAVVDLTLMLNTTTVPRTPGGHGCASGTLPSSVVRFIASP